MTEPGSVFTATMRIELHLPEAGSLKAKRAILNKAKAAIQRDLGASVAEVGFQDLWQRSALGIAAAASTESGAERVADRVVAIVERDPRVVVTSQQTIVDYLEAGAPIDLPDVRRAVGNP